MLFNLLLLFVVGLVGRMDLVFFLSPLFFCSLFLSFFWLLGKQWLIQFPMAPRAELWGIELIHVKNSKVFSKQIGHSFVGGQLNMPKSGSHWCVT
jgi:hypothetical protein